MKKCPKKVLSDSHHAITISANVKYKGKWSDLEKMGIEIWDRAIKGAMEESSDKRTSIKRPRTGPPSRLLHQAASRVTKPQIVPWMRPNT